MDCCRQLCLSGILAGGLLVSALSLPEAAEPRTPRPSADPRGRSTPKKPGENAFSFVRLVDTTAMMPGGATNFALFNAPSTDGTSIVFRGEGPVPAVNLDDDPDNDEPIPTGLYQLVINGPLTLIADLATPYPMSQEEFDIIVAQEPPPVDPNDAPMFPLTFTNFRPFEPPIVAGNTVVFTGSIQGLKIGLLTGLFRTVDAGPIERRLTTLFDVEPVGGRTFNNFFRPSYANGKWAFGGISGQNYVALYTLTDSGLTELANIATPIPGSTATFNDFGYSGPGATAVLDTGIAFIGRSLGATPNIEGVYFANGGISAVVDSNTPVPSGSGNFGRGFTGLSGSGQQLALLHTTQGIFQQVAGGDVTAVLAASTPLPSFPVLRFNTFQALATTGPSSVAGVAGFNFQSSRIQAQLGQGLYVDQGNGLEPLVLTPNRLTIALDPDNPMTMTQGGTVLDGKLVTSVTIAPAGWSPAGLTFQVTFDDMSQALYLAQPTP